jgi:hypothetical protein
VITASKAAPTKAKDATKAPDDTKPSDGVAKSLDRLERDQQKQAARSAKEQRRAAKSSHG